MSGTINAASVGVEMQMRQLRQELMNHAIINGLDATLSRVLAGLNAALAAIDAAQLANNNKAWSAAGDRIEEAGEAITASKDALQKWVDVTSLLGSALTLANDIKSSAS